MTVENPSFSPHQNARMPTMNSSILTLSPSQSPRCTQCNIRQKENTRNLVVCVDGTSNQFGHNNTNVVKLFAKIDQEASHPQQYAYYSSGIGTSAKASHIIGRMVRAVSNKFEMAAAWNIEEIVKDAYSWLARTYQDGDQIYLFGFSRGAYQVRVLAEMIHEVGLIRTPTEKQIETAYDHYEAVRSGKPKVTQIAGEFKNTFSWKGVGVHFVGVWDTVSSVGLVREDVFLSTSSSAVHACHFRHALALDELRVKFMPEYFHEMNSQADDVKSKYIVTDLDVEHLATPACEVHSSASSDNSTDSSEAKKTAEIKEVWFAGSHSDVGGKHRPGESHQSGNVSLLWMRREAAANGLALQPTDIVWVPDDLDFGIKNSMTPIWRAIEYMPIKHQVSFSGSGEDGRRSHLLQPRRIIPGQKVHASILYANLYQPHATLGEGFDVPIIHCGLEDLELDKQFWETGFFDESAAKELVNYLSSSQGVAPVYLARLLFMLRFKEGKQCVRNVPGWDSQLRKLILDPECTQLVRLVAIAAYFEASCDHETNPNCHALSDSNLSQDIFDDAKGYLRAILANHRQRDGPSMVALLRPLTKHPDLRKCILTNDVLEDLVALFDDIVTQLKENFGQAMDGLHCLLECKETRHFLVQKLGANPPNYKASRLSQILEVDDPHLLTAALRMVLTLARIPQGRVVCSQVKPRIRKLASKNEHLVGLLAVEILFALYDRNDQGQLDFRDTHVRANLASALIRWETDRHGLADGQNPSVDPGKQILRDFFGLDARELNLKQKKLIGELKMSVQKESDRERTAATMTLLKLCETTAIRTYLCEINLLDIYISQLRRKESALLAAYALATCLKHKEMKESIKDNDCLPKHIVYMLRLDYFDDSIGHVEGFQIFGDLMGHADLRAKIVNYDITEVLKAKLVKGKPKEIRTSLVCLQIFRFFYEHGSWTYQLVDKSLELLRNPAWKAQKAGVTILSALAQTKHGVEAIMSRVQKVVLMLLPDSTTPPKTPSWMMGPACALRILAQNEVLRNRIRETTEYGNLKHLYLSGTLVHKTDTSAWRVKTPNRADVIIMLEKMIKTIDGELSGDGPLSIGDAVPPHIQHWDRLLVMLRTRTVAVVTILPLLGVSILAAAASVAVTPIYLSVRVYEFLRRLQLRNHILGGLLYAERPSETDSARGAESASVAHDGGDHSGGHEAGSQVLKL
ncbi:Uncharacterized alpha/beta hydrolase domain (DUF2235) domain containing protein [Tylopilus felleus]